MRTWSVLHLVSDKVAEILKKQLMNLEKFLVFLFVIFACEWSVPRVLSEFLVWSDTA